MINDRYCVAQMRRFVSDGQTWWGMQVGMSLSEWWILQSHDWRMLLHIRLDGMRDFTRLWIRSVSRDARANFTFTNAIFVTQGMVCANRCPEGFWGNNCSQTCDCYNEAGCNHITGECQCKLGSYGDKVREHRFGLIISMHILNRNN